MSGLPMHSFLLKSIDAADLGANSTGSAIDCREVLSVSAQAVWSGGASTSGTIVFEGSLDGVNFNTIGSYTVSTNSGSYLVNAERAGYLYVRMTWTRSAGSGGTITANVSGKRL